MTCYFSELLLEENHGGQTIPRSDQWCEQLKSLETTAISSPAVRSDRHVAGLKLTADKFNKVLYIFPVTFSSTF